MNRYAQSTEYHGPRGFLRPVGDYVGSRFQNRIYSCIEDARQCPGPVPSWEESRRYWSAILEEDIRTNFARSRKKKNEQVGYTSLFLSDSGIDPSQGRPSTTVRQVVSVRTGEHQVILPSLGSPFDIRYPNGMRYQYDGNAYLRVFYEDA